MWTTNIAEIQRIILEDVRNATKNTIENITTNMNEIPQLVKELSTPEELRNAGDFAYAKVTTAFNGLMNCIVMRCPFCANPISMPLSASKIKRFFTAIVYKLLNRRGELLTFNKPCFCSCCLTKFEIIKGEVKRLES